MADVHVLPGVERRDLAGPPVSVERLFEAALEVGISDVVIVGRDRTGELYVASCGSDADRDAGLLMRAVHLIVSATFEHAEPIKTDPPVG